MRKLIKKQIRPENSMFNKTDKKIMIEKITADQYAAPSCKVTVVRIQGILCESTGNTEGYDTENGTW